MTNPFARQKTYLTIPNYPRIIGPSFQLITLNPARILPINPNTNEELARLAN